MCAIYVCTFTYLFSFLWDQAQVSNTQLSNFKPINIQSPIIQTKKSNKSKTSKINPIAFPHACILHAHHFSCQPNDVPSLFPPTPSHLQTQYTPPSLSRFSFNTNTVEMKKNSSTPTEPTSQPTLVMPNPYIQHFFGPKIRLTKADFREPSFHHLMGLKSSIKKRGIQIGGGSTWKRALPISWLPESKNTKKKLTSPMIRHS